jgi:hypothetical protein
MKMNKIINIHRVFKRTLSLSTRVFIRVHLRDLRAKGKRAHRLTQIRADKA